MLPLLVYDRGASRLFERGSLDMMEISSVTGYKTLNMLRRYTHLRAEDLALVAEL
jgi:hypothetical protein